MSTGFGAQTPGLFTEQPLNNLRKVTTAVPADHGNLCASTPIR